MDAAVRLRRRRNAGERLLTNTAHLRCCSGADYRGSLSSKYVDLRWRLPLLLWLTDRYRPLDRDAVGVVRQTTDHAHENTGGPKNTFLNALVRIFRSVSEYHFTG